MPNTFAVAGRSIGPGMPCFIIAEAGVNHNGDLRQALNLVDVAADAGADAVKFQTFDADRLVTRDAPMADYQKTSASGESHHAMLKRLELSLDDHRVLVARCEQRRLIFLSTAFDEEAADLLYGFGMAAFKTPSGELTNLSYLQHLARLGKPMIISTGMSTLDEVEKAVSAVRAAGVHELALLHCTSNYPAEPTNVNLRAMHTLAQSFGVPVGYSDHTLGLAITFAAAALGACVIEKHFTLDRRLPGPDHKASIEPQELVALVRGVRAVEASLGDGKKLPRESELPIALVARKSLVVARDLAPGDVITDVHLVAKRPGTGLALEHRAAVVGRKARVAAPAGTVLTWEMLA